MTTTPPFDFAVTYDSESVRAAAHSLFLMQQRRLLWISLGGLLFCFLTTGGAAWYLHSLWMLWFPSGLLVLNALLPLYSRRAIRRRLERSMTGKSAQIRLSAADFSIVSEGGSHILPWKNFVSTRRDPKNLLLCFPRLGAIVIPMRSAPEGAVEFAEARIRDANRAV